jgi:tRNA threonylcarbamoyladenosine biosynthesis protein TsaE
MEKKYRLSLLSTSPEDTALLGKTLAAFLRGGEIIGLSGELGAGKTVLVKGACQALEVKERVTSSTFVLLRSLNGRLPVYHLDLYRLSCHEDLHDIGYEDFLYGEGISLIEWPEKLNILPDDHYLHIALEYVPDHANQRKITLSTAEPAFQNMLHRLAFPLQVLSQDWIT